MNKSNANQKKILIHSNYNPENIGGIETVVSQIIGTLGLDGYDVECFCGQAGASGVSEHKGRPVFHHRIIAKIFGAPILHFGNVKFLLHGRRADLVIFQEPFPFLWPSLFFLRRLFGSAVIVLVHANPNAPSVVQWLYNKLRNIVFKGSICVTTSPSQLRQIDSSAYASRSVIPLGVAEINHLNVNQKERNYVLYIGRLAEYKGIEQLLKTVENLPQVRFVVAGAGPLSHKVREFEANGKHTNLTFIDRFVSEDEKIELISDCSFLAFPSTNKNEAFGIVQLEAMRAGKPIVNTWLDSGVNYVAPDGVCAITVPPLDSDALSKAVVKLWSDSKLRHSLGEAARRRYVQLFSETTFGESWSGLVRKLLQK